MKQLILNHKQSYIHLDIVYNMNKLIKQAIHYQHVDSNHSNILNHLEKIKQYEDNRKSKKRKRYGYVLKILLPKGDLKDNLNQLKQITKRMCQSIFNKEKLVYFSYLSNTFRDVWYLNIYIADREYYGFYKEYYKRDYYIDKQTGTWASPTDPNAVILHKKGSVKRIVKDCFSICKSTIFTGTRKRFLQLIDDMKKLYVSILAKLQYIFQSEFIFKHKKYSSNTHRFQKRILSKLNMLMYKMEYQIDHIINQTSYYLHPYQLAKEGLQDGTVHCKYRSKIESLFYKFQKRLQNMKFHIDGVLFYLNTRVDIAEANILLLEQEFNKEIQHIVEGHNDL